MREDPATTITFGDGVTSPIDCGYSLLIKMERSKLLITGSRGLIGTILLSGLADRFNVFGVDRRGSSTPRTFVADLSDYDQIATVLRAVSPLRCIVHLAADRRVEAGWASVLKNNIIATRNLYEAARTHGVKRVVFASSNHVTGSYARSAADGGGQGDPQTVTVRHPVRPDSDYATSKVFGEAVARQHYDLFNIESVCLRIGSVIADDDPTKSRQHRRMWLSHKDLIQLVERSVVAGVKFGIYYGVSNNQDRIWDLSNANDELGYRPESDASRFK